MSIQLSTHLLKGTESNKSQDINMHDQLESPTTWWTSEAGQIETIRNPKLYHVVFDIPIDVGSISNKSPWFLCKNFCQSSQPSCNISVLIVWKTKNWFCSNLRTIIAMIDAKFSFCTEISIMATASSFKAPAVSVISFWQLVPGSCIPNNVVRTLNTIINSWLTIQYHMPRLAFYRTYILRFKPFPHRGINEVLWWLVITLVLKSYLNIEFELVELGEDRNDWD